MVSFGYKLLNNMIDCYNSHHLHGTFI